MNPLSQGMLLVSRSYPRGWLVPVAVRSLVVYASSILLLRLMCKGLTFQRKPYDFVVMMLIGSASAVLMVNVPGLILNSLITRSTLALMHTLIGLLPA